MTVVLLRLNAVVGVKGTVDRAGQLTKVGVTCALCHSSVDDSFAPGIGKRLDGWANTDLNVGAIVALSPALDDATKAEFRTWGPGKYDPRHHAFDGTNIIPLNSPSLPIVIPPIYGLKGVGFETFTGDGPISYWNSYVGVGQMGGHGNFSDPRIGLFIRQTPDLVTPKLAALLDYQLSLRTPKPPRGSFNRAAAERGKRSVPRARPGAARAISRRIFTDVLSGPDRRVPFLHDPAEVGMDPAYAARSATGKYRTTPLRGLLQHPPYFHDGSAPDLLAVVNHYDELFGLNLTAASEGGSRRVSEVAVIDTCASGSPEGQVSPTRVTLETLMPSAPPAPSRIPLTDTRLPTWASSRDSTNFKRHGPAAELARRIVGADAALVHAQRRRGVGDRPVGAALGRQAADHAHQRVGRQFAGPSFGMIWMLATASGETSAVPAGNPLDFRMSATRSL